jgi:two-component system cell cycle response regulator
VTFSAGSVGLAALALLLGAAAGWVVRGFLARKSAATLRAVEGELKRKDEALRTAEELLAETSLTDSLTGAHNQRFVDAAIGTLLAPARRPARAGDPAPEHAVLMLAEVDGFDDIDARGKDIGDALLRDTAQSLLPLLRGGTVVARWTETAFLVVARIRFAGEARGLAARLRAAVTGSVRVRDDLRPVTLSIGFSIEPVSRAHPHLTSFRDHLALMDAALRRAQAQGGDRAVGWRSNDEVVERAIASRGEAEVAAFLRTDPAAAEAEGLISQVVERRERTRTSE